MSFKFFGIEIYVSFYFLAIITIMLYTDKTGLASIMLFAIFLHELGHVLAMILLSCRVLKIRLIPSSVQIVKDSSKGYESDLLIALAGPFANFIAFMVFKGCFENFALINFAVGAYNLLPFKGLDGGTICYSVLCKMFDINKAASILKYITITVAVILIIGASMLWLFEKGNISLLIISAYLLVTSLLKL
jgi:stage IV sporulation protein FB